MLHNSKKVKIYLVLASMPLFMTMALITAMMSGGQMPQQAVESSAKITAGTFFLILYLVFILCGPIFAWLCFNFRAIHIKIVAFVLFVVNTLMSIIALSIFIPLIYEIYKWIFGIV